MLHHISLPVSNLEKSSLLYDQALAALGYRRVCSGDDFAGYGVKDGEDILLLRAQVNTSCAGAGFHLALAAPDREAVDRFHRIALQFGARDNGAPGLRPHFGENYYAAFIIDPDGHRLEAVIIAPDA